MRPPDSSVRALCIAALFAALPACGSSLSASLSPASAPPQSGAVAASSGGGAMPPAMAPSAPYALSPASSVAPAARASMGIALAPASSGTPFRAQESTASSANAPSPMLVYTANLALAVEAVPASIERSIQIANSAGGYLASRGDAAVQLRVPTPRFRDVMASLEALGDVTHRDVQAEDVSEQYHDLEVQLANLRAVRGRLQDFLGRAASVHDALEVERELERVGAQIDQTEGRIAFLSNRAAYSTLTVTLAQRAHALVVTDAPAPAAPAVALPFAWIQRLDLRSLLQL